MKKNVVHQKKAESGWYDRTTPPTGFKVNEHVIYMVNNDLVSALYIQVCELDSSVQDNGSFFTLTIPTNGIPPLPPVISTHYSTDVQILGRRETCQARNSDNNSIASVTSNIIKHQGSLYDAHFNQIL